MAKIYQVVHYYEVDGGFGDSVSVEDTIATFASYEDAKAFVDRFEKPHAYDKPYSYLRCGELAVMESDIIQKGELDLDDIDTGDFWWLYNKVLE